MQLDGGKALVFSNTIGPRSVMNVEKSVSIVYMSCDRYSDVWTEYFRLFRSYWPQCPFKIYILSNNANAAIDNVEILKVGQDLSWSDNLYKALNQVDTQYVLLLLDDFFLVDPVPHDWVLSKISWALEKRVDCLRFSACVPKPTQMVDDDIGYIPPGAIYRTSTRFPLWKIETLKQVLKSGESAWDFEIAGSVRSDRFLEFYATRSDPFKFANCIIKGRWDPRAIRQVHLRGARLELSKRPMMTRWEIMGDKFLVFRSWVLNMMPYRSRRAVRERIQGLLAKLRRS